jgi:hypothetical protein
MQFVSKIANAMQGILGSMEILAWHVAVEDIRM